MSAPTPSLIQQRMAITRDRTLSILLTVSGVFTAVSGAIRIVGGANNPVVDWIAAAAGLALAALSAVRAVKATRRLRTFEAEHGADAGKQRPIGR